MNFPKCKKDNCKLSYETDSPFFRLFCLTCNKMWRGQFKGTQVFYEELTK
jgi:hypothetical protein